MQVAKHYFEAHVTLDPVFNQDRCNVDDIARANSFKLAKLFMVKGVQENGDTFCTGHSVDMDLLVARLKSLVSSLQSSGYRVRRYKIEDCVLDSRIQDELGLL